MATKTASNLITDEDDDDAGNDDAGTSNQTLRPVQPAPIRVGARKTDEDDEQFEVLEVDDDGKPLNQVIVGDDRQRERRERNLSEDESGEETLIEQKAREAETDRTVSHPSRSSERRRFHKELGRKKSAENKQLRDTLARQDRELQELRAKIGVVEPRVIELGAQRLKDQEAQLDNQIAAAGREVKAAQQAMIDAWDSGDKAAQMDALELRDKALIKQTRLENTKSAAAFSNGKTSGGDQDDHDLDTRRTDNRRGNGRDQTQQAQPSPIVQRYIREFSDEFDWYDSSGRDRDSGRVLMLDREVAAEGYNPESAEYWDELRNRMREILPKRFEDQSDGSNRRNGKGRGNGEDESANERVSSNRRGPMTSGPSDRPQNGRTTQVRLSRERKNALIDANVIGNDGQILDTDKFKRVLKKYAEYDRAYGADRQ